LVRVNAAGVLAKFSDIRAPFEESEMRQIWEAWIAESDPAVRSCLAKALKFQVNNERKLDKLIEVTERASWVTRDLIAEHLLINVFGDSQEQRRTLALAVIGAACRNRLDERTVEILAGIIVGSSGGTKQAGRLIEDAQAVQKVDEYDIRPLRVEIGGSVALRPVTQQLENRLLDPLDALAHNCHS